MAENKTIQVINGHTWAEVATLDGAISVSVSLSNLLWDTEGKAYLLVFKDGLELRLYVEHK